MYVEAEIGEAPITCSTCSSVAPCCMTRLTFASIGKHALALDAAHFIDDALENSAHRLRRDGPWLAPVMLAKTWSSRFGS